MVARRREDTAEMITPRGGVSVGRASDRRRGLLLGAAALEAADVGDEVPALLLGQVLPRRHRTLAVRHLAEEHAVGIGLYLGRRPVRGLGSERRGGHAVTLAGGAMAGDAVRLRRFLAGGGVARALQGLVLGVLA